MHINPLTLLLSISITTPLLTIALPHLPQPLHHRTPTPTLPTSTLPAPPNSLTLKYIALGLGTQNYSCAASPTSPSSTPLAIGALATLYDATHLFSTLGPAALTALTTTLPCLADMLGTPLLPLLPHLGTHYFDALGRPTFDLAYSSTKAFLSAKKVAAVPAPKGACAGRNDAGAVDWLLLGDGGAGLSRGGVSAVFRVETAGGKAVVGACEGGGGGGGGGVESDYAALYWFYG